MRVSEIHEHSWYLLIGHNRLKIPILNNYWSSPWNGPTLTPFSWLRICSWSSAPIVVWFDEPVVGYFYLTWRGFKWLWEVNSLTLEISFDCERAVRVGPFHGEDQIYIIVLAFLVSYIQSNGFTNTLLSVIHSFAILLSSIWYKLETLNFSFERIKST